MKNFYLTTTLPYVNDEPHLGHAMEFVHADIIARYQRILGNEVFFNIGTDEHGQKIYEKAKQEKRDIQEYVDHYANRFKEFAKKLNISNTNFIRTTDPSHVKSAQEFWKHCAQNGDIYKKHYKVKYCIGCELEKTDSELKDGYCVDHPNKELEIREEENYFFRFSKYQNKLLDLYKSNSDFVIPSYRLNEFIKMSEGGLQDFSISRLKSKMSWGVPVPEDDEHVMYVWFDALVNYISTIGWTEDIKEFEKWWPVVQFAGKDQVRMQAGMWQAMLMSAKLPPSKQIIIHGFLMTNGQKMSKSLGNVISPFAVIDEYGTDALRYYLSREVSSFEDSDITMEKINTAYNANLANGIGNLTSRIMKMAEDNLDSPVETEQFELLEEFKLLLDKFEIQKASDFVWDRIAELDGYIQKTEPFKLVKENSTEAKKIIKELVQKLHEISILLTPFLPETAEKIKEAIKENKKPETLFERKKVKEQIITPSEKMKDISIAIEHNLADRGVKVVAVLCKVSSVQKRRSGELQKLIEKELSNGMFDHMKVFNEYKKFYHAVNMEHETAAEHLLGIFNASQTIPNINRVVDCCNLTSLKTGLSFGAHDVRGIVGDLRFAYTDGNEKYIPLGANKETKVLEGEYAFMDEEKILCRMDIKQCEETKITSDTKEFVLYAQGNKEVSMKSLENALDEVCKNIEKFCGGECHNIKVSSK